MSSLSFTILWISLLVTFILAVNVEGGTFCKFKVEQGYHPYNYRYCEYGCCDPIGNILYLSCCLSRNPYTTLTTSTSFSTTSRPLTTSRSRYNIQNGDKRLTNLHKPPQCPNEQWTPFFNEDRPSGHGDFEDLNLIQTENPGQVCSRPVAVDARLVATNAPYYTSGESVSIGPTLGLTCWNNAQTDGRCQNYKVRFCCPGTPIGLIGLITTNHLTTTRSGYKIQHVNNRSTTNPPTITCKIAGTTKGLIYFSDCAYGCCGPLGNNVYRECCLSSSSTTKKQNRSHVYIISGVSSLVLIFVIGIGALYCCIRSHNRKTTQRTQAVQLGNRPILSPQLQVGVYRTLENNTELHEPVEPPPYSSLFPPPTNCITDQQQPPHTICTTDLLQPPPTNCTTNLQQPPHRICTTNENDPPSYSLSTSLTTDEQEPPPYSSLYSLHV